MTGSSMGIGRSLTDHLLALGHTVWGLSRSDQSDHTTAHPAFISSVCDVSNYAAVEDVANLVAQRWHTVDGLIACAGMQGEIGRTLDSDPARWTTTTRVNLEGTYNTLRAFGPLLRATERRAKVICFSGGGSTKARANFSAYGAAKTAIVRLVETVAIEEKHGLLDINAIAPGAINTRMTEQVIRLGPTVVGDDEYRMALKQRMTGGASLTKVFGLVDWLLSPNSDGISGRLISAQWDAWEDQEEFKLLAISDHYTLRRVIPGQHAQSS